MADRDSQITYRSENLEEGLIQKVEQVAHSENIPEKAEKKRLNSLDILRGLTMMGMIMVDCKGPDAPWWIRHPSWDGMSPADYVFPSFLFIMGMAVPLALSKNKPFSLKSVLRIIGLFVIGLIINVIDQDFDFGQVRIMGILQRLSICYFLVSVIHFVTRYADPKYRFIGVIIAISITLIYIIFMSTFENLEIGCPYALRYTKPCNFGGYFDRTLFGKHHIINPSDPEGFFASVSSFLNAFIGYWFCLIMLDNKNNINKTLYLWTIFSLFLAVNYYPLTFLMPFHKRMWTTTYVFLTASVTGVILVIITYLFDVLSPKKQKYKRITDKISQPFIWLGLNPLAIYTLMQLLTMIQKVYIKIDGKSGYKLFYEYVFLSWIGNGEVASVMESVFFLIFWTLIAFLLFKRNIFIRL